MRRAAYLVLIAAIWGCGADPRALSGADDDGGMRLRRLLGPHRAVIEGADSARVCRMKTDPMAQADARAPAPMTRFLGYQEVEASSELLETNRLADIRTLLLDPASFELERSVTGLLSPCPVMLVLRAGEDARVVGVDLQRALVEIKSGTSAQAPVRLHLSASAAEDLRALIAVPMKEMR